MSDDKLTGQTLDLIIRYRNNYHKWSLMCVVSNYSGVKKWIIDVYLQYQLTTIAREG